MPIYEYKCKPCNKNFEKLQGLNEKGLENCPVCGSCSIYRVLTSGIFTFKGGSPTKKADRIIEYNDV